MKESDQDHRDIITARVRSTREGNVLTSVCPSIHPSVCPQGGGGGVRVPPPGGLGTPPGGSWYPRGGRVPPRGSGYPLGGSGYPPGGGQVPPGGGVPGQVPPRPGQKEYSLHGGRYASCVHAGGLSCLTYF